MDLITIESAIECAEAVRNLAREKLIPLSRSAAAEYGEVMEELDTLMRVLHWTRRQFIEHHVESQMV